MSSKLRFFTCRLDFFGPIKSTKSYHNNFHGFNFKHELDKELSWDVLKLIRWTWFNNNTKYFLMMIFFLVYKIFIPTISVMWTYKLVHLSSYWSCLNCAILYNFQTWSSVWLDLELELLGYWVNSRVFEST